MTPVPFVIPPDSFVFFDDVQLVQLSYQTAVQQQVDTYITNMVDGAEDAEGKFARGLKIIRDARDRAMELVRQ